MLFWTDESAVHAEQAKGGFPLNGSSHPVLAAVLAGIAAFGSASLRTHGDAPHITALQDEAMSVATYSASSALSFSGTAATCISTLHGSAALVRRLPVRQELQRLNTSGNWSCTAQWTQTVQDFCCAVTKTAYNQPGGTYRLCSTFTVYTANASETLTVYSTLRTV